MWFVQPKQDYVSQALWKHADEAAVMSWQIRARNYDTFINNIAVWGFALVFSRQAFGSLVLPWGLSLFLQGFFYRWLWGV